MYIAYNLCPIENTFIPIKTVTEIYWVRIFLKASDASFHEFHTLLENVPKVLSLSPVSAVNDSTNYKPLLSG